MRGMSDLVGIAWPIVVIIALALLRDTDVGRGLDRAWTDAGAPFVPLLLVAAGLGFLVFWGGIVYGLAHSSTSMTRAEIEDLYARNKAMFLAPIAIFRTYTYRLVRALFQGRSFHDEASFAEVKDAWRRGAWRTEVRWKRNFLMAGGAAPALIGGSAALALGGPFEVKVVFGAALLYAIARTTIAFARA